MRRLGRSFAKALLPCLAALTFAAPAQAQTTVFADWPLKPDGLSPGNQFRLLVVTSTKRNGASNSLGDFDTYVQNVVSAGHASIQSYSSGFKAIASTASTAARDHTGTTYTATDKGVPIYYLNGDKVADNYEDFYDGSWDTHSSKDESGNASVETRVWTGSNSDGTSHSLPLGTPASDHGQRGDPTSSTDDFVLSRSSTVREFISAFYGLSQVFEVDTSLTNAPTVSSVAVTSTPSAASDTYGAGGKIEFTVTFSEAVEVSLGLPHFEFALENSGSPTVNKDAAYQRGSGTTALVFAYTVVAADMDDDGIWVGDQSRTLMLDTGEYIRAVDDQILATLTHAQLGQQSGHKVDGSLMSTNRAPVISTTSPQSVAENTTAVVTLAATDADSGDTLTWSLNGGADADKFTLTGNMLTFTTAPDFGNPTDTGTDNGYEVNVRVTDGTANVDLALTVNVTEVVDETAPMVTKAEVDGTTLTIFYDEPLDETSQPSVNGFIALRWFVEDDPSLLDPGVWTSASYYCIAGNSVGGCNRALSSVLVSGSNVILTLPDIVSAEPEHLIAVQYSKSHGVTPIKDLAGNEAASVVGTKRTYATTVSGAPVNLMAMPNTDNGGTQIDLSWEAPEPEPGVNAPTGYKIEWSANAGTDWQELVADTGNTDTTYKHTGLDSETTYHYRVTARNGVDFGGTTAAVSATTDDITGPAPTAASVPATGASLAITFNEALDGTAANKPAPGDFTVTTADGATGVGGVGVSGMTVTLTGLNPTIKRGETVTVGYTDPRAGDSVAVQDDDGNAASFEDFAVTNISNVDPEVPSAPLNLEALATATDRVQLTWQAPARANGAPITGYKIETAPDDNASFTTLVTNTGNTNTDYEHTGLTLTPDDAPLYRVSAMNFVGAGSVSNVARAETRGLRPVSGSETNEDVTNHHARMDLVTRELGADTAEGLWLTEGWTQKFRVLVTGDNTAARVVDLSATGTANSSDYSLYAGGRSLGLPYQVTIPAGEDSVEFRVGVLHDGNDREGTETLSLSASHDGVALNANPSTIHISPCGGSDPRAFAWLSVDGEDPLKRHDPVFDAEDPIVGPDFTLRVCFRDEVRGVSIGHSGSLSIIGRADTEDKPNVLRKIDGDLSNLVQKVSGQIWTADVHANDAGQIYFFLNLYNLQYANSNSIQSPSQSIGWQPRVYIPRVSTPGEVDQGPEPLTARFSPAPPTEHVGTPFEFQVEFSSPVPVGGSDMRRAIEITGGKVTSAARVNGSAARWKIKVTPDGNADISMKFRLPEGCGIDHLEALCSGDGRRLSTALSALVRGYEIPQPENALTARFLDYPSEHFKKFYMKISFSEPVAASRQTLENALDIDWGDIRKLERVDGRSDLWQFLVYPKSFNYAMDITVSISSPTSDCSNSRAICSDGGNALHEGASVTIKGPAVLSITDATGQEAAGASVNFRLTLSRPLTVPGSVMWFTEDITAKNGEDFEGGEGMVHFTRGDISKTLVIPIIDDGHNEGEETFKIILYSDEGLRLARQGDNNEAIGTIKNSDRLPNAWLSRFGRTVSMHTLEAIEARLRGEMGQNQLTLGGRQVGGLLGPQAWWRKLGSETSEPQEETARRDRRQSDSISGAGDTDDNGTDNNPPGGNLAGGSQVDGYPAGDSLMGGNGTSSMPGAGDGEGSGRAPAQGRAAWQALKQALGLPEFGGGIKGSSFFYSPAAQSDAGSAAEPGSDAKPGFVTEPGFDTKPGVGEPPGRGWLDNWSAWGHTASTRFSGADGPLALDGEVDTATLGVDTEKGRWLTGLLLAHSEGDGTYNQHAAQGGAVKSTLTSLHPFARYTLNARTSVWGALGYGVGDLTLTPEQSGTAIKTDLATTMAALGGRGVLGVRSGRGGVLEFALRSDALFTHTASNATEGMVSGTGATSRVRLVLEGTSSFPLPATGGVLMPTLEAGLRYDGGDAETGAGLELGGGLGYAAGRLLVQVNARTLLAHEDTEYEEWGFSSSLMYRPRADGRGLSMNLGSVWGNAQSGVEALWTRETADGLAQGLGINAAQLYRAELGYALLGPKGRVLWTPFLGLESGAGQALKLGVRLTSGANLDAGLELGQRTNGPGGHDYSLQLGWQLRW